MLATQLAYQRVRMALGRQEAVEPRVSTEAIAVAALGGGVRALDGVRKSRGYSGRRRADEDKRDRRRESQRREIHGEHTSVASPLSVAVRGERPLSVVVAMVHGGAPPSYSEGVPASWAEGRHPGTRVVVS